MTFQEASCEGFKEAEVTMIGNKGLRSGRKFINTVFYRMWDILSVPNELSDVTEFRRCAGVFFFLLLILKCNRAEISQKKDY